MYARYKRQFHPAPSQPVGDILHSRQRLLHHLGNLHPPWNAMYARYKRQFHPAPSQPVGDILHS
ncbi:hypothetical protein QWT36_23835, partial [Salmonella enterica subsp. enterica serovar Typhi]|nr:hypothetical protein [Salmonella enterica subsp. enterica serovar Typhi]